MQWRAATNDTIEWRPFSGFSSLARCQCFGNKAAIYCFKEIKGVISGIQSDLWDPIFLIAVRLQLMIICVLFLQTTGSSVLYEISSNNDV
eukprot:scaffold446674_cov23-Prasinocladus_malaysianus.AAC.1